jgi:hypothetical protein
LGWGEIFSGENGSGELERLLEAASGDETARAAAGQLVQVRGRIGVARAVVEQGWWLAVVVMRWRQAGGAGRRMAGGDDTGG